MKRKAILLLCVVVSIFYSCHKSTEQMLVGKWIGEESIVDGKTDPKNNIFRATELTLYSDGTGTKNFFVMQPLTWSYNETTNKLHIETETAQEEELIFIGDTIDHTVLLVEKSKLQLQYVGKDENAGKVYTQTYYLQKD